MFDFITDAWENLREFVVSVFGTFTDHPVLWVVVGMYAAVTISFITVVAVRVESRRDK